jgi:hypothetical protein
MLDETRVRDDRDKFGVLFGVLFGTCLEPHERVALYLALPAELQADIERELEQARNRMLRPSARTDRATRSS